MPKGQAVSGKANAWNDSSEKRLLLLFGLKGNDWSFIAEKMGPTYSASACSQKYQKLKKAIETEFGAVGGSGTWTPSKRPRPVTNGSSKKRPSEDDDDDSDKWPDASPSKRLRANGSARSSKNPTNYAEEHNSDDDEPNLQLPKKAKVQELAIVKPEPEPVDVDHEDLYEW